MDAEFNGRLLSLLTGTHERDSASTKLRRVGTWHEDEPSGSGHQLATETGTLFVGQVKLSPTHAADPFVFHKVRYYHEMIRYLAWKGWSRRV
jgi:hypothetical protein